MALNRSVALSRIAPSATIAITQKVRDLTAAGRRDLISLSIGEPDFATPDHVAQAACAAITRGQTKYPPVSGIVPLKDAIVAKFQRENALSYGTGEIVVGNGGKQVIANALLATVNPGDEVIIPAPYWVSYPQLTRLYGATPVFVETTAQTGYRLTAAPLEAAITPRTKWVILNYPSNPSGAVLGRQDLLDLGAVLLKHPHVLVLTDDIYEHLIYDDLPFYTLAQVVPELKDRVLTVNGVSKAYAMTGWRIGYAGGPEPLIKAMELVQSQLTGGACSIAQWAAVAALDGPQQLLDERRRAFDARRQTVARMLDRVPGLRCVTPQGAFYAFPSCADALGRNSPSGKVLRSDTDFAEELLEHAGVGVVPGTAFGAAKHFRVSYAVSHDTLVQACQRIAAFCAALH